MSALLGGDGAVVDHCRYPEGGEPDRRLGRIWAKWGIPDEQRVAMARRVKSIGLMANVASAVKDFEERIKALLSHMNLWPTDPTDQIFTNMMWCSVWADACTMARIVDEQEAEARKDPQKIAEIADIDLSAMWEAFRDSP